jgi:hypothetical protein
VATPPADGRAGGGRPAATARPRGGGGVGEGVGEGVGSGSDSALTPGRNSAATAAAGGGDGVP